MIKTIRIKDLEQLKERGIIVDIDNNLKLDLIYNNFDKFIYISVIDNTNERITGFNKLVPNIDLLALSNNQIPYQLRCIKVNEFANERDYITIDNLNEDYLLFLVGDDDE